ncbi:DUF302 domain-containing protein [Pseudaminobacter soli (ex Li et al. 2025)]|uniref:DUF302 domain-containing protein n=1 Tax=Pseudaminobacter soli (ex Li et al. 2025) TaxID=1295366 RepID=A0A2P7S7Y4_9HYPH|nr:DUF302 domain-containing protein [Mesorhizobium soli]PSJ58584.1 hypothetical protein C7I85_19545 [Mesorhizobium soli]
MSALTEAKTFTGTKLVYQADLPFDEVLRRFHAQVGHADIPTLARLAVETPDEQAYAREIEARFVGKSGFMLFSEIDHGGWIARFGIRRHAIRLIYGNPLIAITMIREDISAGLFVPVEMLVLDTPDGGTTLSYVQPSSLIAMDRENSALRTAAEALDAKVAALVSTILDS